MTTDASGSNPFAGFAGFKPADMMDRMWDMMRMSPFGGMTSFPGATQGLPPSLSSMSDMMAPLTSVEELDKRITDLRAVEQWLKLNLGMLQSAIQALEVQRATLATLRAFGAFAQSSMSAAEEAAVAAAHAAKRVGGVERCAAGTGCRRVGGSVGRRRAAGLRPVGLVEPAAVAVQSAREPRDGAAGMQPAAPGDAAGRGRCAEPARSRHRPPPRKPAAKRAKSAGAAGWPRTRARIVARNPSAEALDVTRRS